MTTLAAGPMALVLGSAAGGGFPQWNCGCELCGLARAADPRVRAATQVGLAVTGDGQDWLLIGASPDLRQQLLDNRLLWPRNDRRDSPVKGVVLTGGDIDAIAGLLVLRERQPFTVYAPQPLLDLLDANPMFGVLDPTLVRRVETTPLQTLSCGAKLSLTMLPMPGKVPLYLEDRSSSQPAAGPNYAVLLRSGDRSMLFAPGCADITDAVKEHILSVQTVFFDGTLFADDEMIKAGLGEKTGRRMGHVPLGGPGGTLERLGCLPNRRILLHINNTNRILMRDSSERRQAEAAGFEIAYDGMEVRL
jgi:pyrroloquinoline quinone biosynthesis protein B